MLKLMQKKINAEKSFIVYLNTFFVSEYQLNGDTHACTYARTHACTQAHTHTYLLDKVISRNRQTWVKNKFCPDMFV